MEGTSPWHCYMSYEGFYPRIAFQECLYSKQTWKYTVFLLGKGSVEFLVAPFIGLGLHKLRVPQL